MYKNKILDLRKVKKMLTSLLVYLLSYVYTFISISDESLSIDHLHFVYNKLYKTRAKWFNIGLALGIDFDSLKSIEEEQLKKHDNCLREMLAHRIQSGGPLTWADLCHCLKCPAVDRRGLENEFVVKGQKRVHVCDII